MRALLVFIALALISQDASAASREVRKRIATVEKQRDQMRDAHDQIRNSVPEVGRDWRDRTKLDDIDQWAFTREVEERVESLLRDARASEDAAAMATVDEAGKLLDAAMTRALEIAGYWRTPGVSWRAHWKAFATANNLPAEPSDPQLLIAEEKVRMLLNSGDFVRAASASDRLDAVLQEVFRGATAGLIQVRGPETLKFVPRHSPCPGTEGTSAKVGIARAASPADYYPAASKRRGEQGAIVLRAHVTPNNCATEFAIVVSSGFPELDQAALRVAEASTYLAASEEGKPIEGYLTFKVKFVFKP
jgi:TonB family protein